MKENKRLKTRKQNNNSTGVRKNQTGDNAEEWAETQRINWTTKQHKRTHNSKLVLVKNMMNRSNKESSLWQQERLGY